MLGVCIIKAWELARLILPSISSRAPDKTHLPAPQEDHGIFFDRRRTPRFLWQGISSILDFTSIRKTRRHSRDALASPVIMCECAMVGAHRARLAEDIKNGLGSRFYSSAARSLHLTQAGAFRV